MSFSRKALRNIVVGGLLGLCTVPVLFIYSLLRYQRFLSIYPGMDVSVTLTTMLLLGTLGFSCTRPEPENKSVSSLLVAFAALVTFVLIVVLSYPLVYEGKNELIDIVVIALFFSGISGYLSGIHHFSKSESKVMRIFRKVFR